MFLRGLLSIHFFWHFCCRMYRLAVITVRCIVRSQQHMAKNQTTKIFASGIAVGSMDIAFVMFCVERLCQHKSHNNSRSAIVWHWPLRGAIYSSSGEQTWPRLADFCRCFGRTEYNSRTVCHFPQEGKRGQWYFQPLCQLYNGASLYVMCIRLCMMQKRLDAFSFCLIITIVQE